MDNEELIKLIFKIGKSEDKKAFSEIFEYYAPRIMGYLIGSGSQREIAEEITQEVLSSVWQKAALFDDKKANLNTWIFTIARNKRIDKTRKNKNPSYNSQDLIEVLYPNNEKQYTNLQEKVEELQSILNKKDRKLIKMNFFEGKSHKIIARELEIPLGTVKSRIRNILIKMKNE